MSVLAFLILFLVVLAGFKLLGLVFKIGIFVLTLPLQILGAVILALIFVLAFPIALVAGITGLILSPLILFVFGPILLIGLGLALILRR